MRSFKPALARDYDVFFAAIGLLCGGILFFQGWRLDPILQFGQFLLAGTTVFFGYESVRLRGVAVDQARRSSFFDDEPSSPRMSSGGFSERFEDSYDQFGESRPLRRRFSASEDLDSENTEEDLYRPRRVSRAAIPEEAVSRRRRPSRNEEISYRENDLEKSRRMARFGGQEESNSDRSQNFGQRRNRRQEERRGSRPSMNQRIADQSGRSRNQAQNMNRDRNVSPTRRPGVPQGSPMQTEAEDAAFTPTSSRPNTSRPINTSMKSKEERSSFSSRTNQSPPTSKSQRPRPRDNSSRFDD